MIRSNGGAVCHFVVFLYVVHLTLRGLVHGQRLGRHDVFGWHVASFAWRERCATHVRGGLTVLLAGLPDAIFGAHLEGLHLEPERSVVALANLVVYGVSFRGGKNLFQISQRLF